MRITDGQKGLLRLFGFVLVVAILFKAAEILDRTDFGLLGEIAAWWFAFYILDLFVMVFLHVLLTLLYNEPALTYSQSSARFDSRERALRDLRREEPWKYWGGVLLGLVPGSQTVATLLAIKWR